MKPGYSLTPQEARKLVASVPCRETQARDAALIRLGLNVGVRVSELTGLDMEDVLTPGGHVTRELTLRAGICKRKKGRVVPLNEKARKALAVIIYWTREHDKDSASHDEGPLIRSVRGRRITPRQVEYIVREAGEWAGLGVVVTPHILRHTFATNCLRASNGNIRVAQALLGHSNIATTARYLHPSREDLAAAVMAM